MMKYLQIIDKDKNFVNKGRILYISFLDEHPLLELQNPIVLPFGPKTVSGALVNTRLWNFNKVTGQIKSPHNDEIHNDLVIHENDMEYFHQQVDYLLRLQSYGR